MKYLISISISISMILFLSGCSKVEYNEKCIPPMTYKFPIELPFVLTAITDGPSGYIQKQELIADIAIQTSFKNVPSSMVDDVILVQSDTIKLQGPVIRYLSSSFDPYDNDTIYFYAEISGHYAWVTIDRLISLASDFPNDSNQENQLRLTKGRFENYGRDFTLQCLTNKSDHNIPGMF